MSFRRPRICHKSSTSPDKSSKSELSYLVKSADFPRQRRASRTSNLFLPGPENLVTLPGHQEFTHAATRLHWQARDQRATWADETPFGFSSSGEPPQDGIDFSNIIHTTYMQDSTAARTSRKQCEWIRWSAIVIPSLIDPFLHLLYETQSLRVAPPPTNSSNGCLTSVRRLKIVCVHFDCKYPAL